MTRFSNYNHFSLKTFFSEFGIQTQFFHNKLNISPYHQDFNLQELEKKLKANENQIIQNDSDFFVDKNPFNKILNSLKNKSVQNNYSNSFYLVGTQNINQNYLNSHYIHHHEINYPFWDKLNIIGTEAHPIHFFTFQFRNYSKKNLILKRLNLNEKKEISKKDFINLGAINKPELRFDANRVAKNRVNAIKKHMYSEMGLDQLGNTSKFEKKEIKRVKMSVIKEKGKKLKWENTEKKKVTRAANMLYLKTFDLRNRKNIGVNARFRTLKPSSKKMQRIKSILAGKFNDKNQEEIKKRNLLKRWDEKMRIVFGRKKVNFIAAASNEDSIPVWTKKTAIPEFAFVGRSNVGKSSLLNAIGLSKKARVDSRPGKTQTLNFYNLNNYLMLVDMPGYGFAYSYERDMWYKLTTLYLAKRKLLKRVFLLIDSRHGIKPSDREIMEHLDKHGKFFQVILTKNDLVAPDDLARRMEIIEREVATFRYGIPQVLIVSTRTQSGIHELRRTLIGFVKFQKNIPKENVEKQIEN